MKDNCILTAESVTEGHPDKLCDTIADAVVDACLTRDAAARVACEVMATAGKIIAAGEITAAKIPDIPATIRRTVREAGYGGSDYEVEVITHEQESLLAAQKNAIDFKNGILDGSKQQVKLLCELIPLDSMEDVNLKSTDEVVQNAVDAAGEKLGVGPEKEENSAEEVPVPEAH